MIRVPVAVRTSGDQQAGSERRHDGHRRRPPEPGSDEAALRAGRASGDRPAAGPAHHQHLDRLLLALLLT